MLWCWRIFGRSLQQRQNLDPHECGHYFDLYHIWGAKEGGQEEDVPPPSCRGSDNVSDTPNQFKANFTKPTFPSVSLTNGPNGDMFMNYMDYVDDESMYMFTQGQVRRMRSAINGPVLSLLQSTGLVSLDESEVAFAETSELETDGAQLVFNGVEYVEA